ncbi:Protein HID1 [Leucoagaricus sp. SymC.cos]|nr:Protein HID1 [Leucoagaricus sp. SymC.cos]
MFSRIPQKFSAPFGLLGDEAKLAFPSNCLVRRALSEAPENVATLIRVVTSRLFSLLSDHTFPSISSSSVTALATSFIKAGGGSTERNATKEVLNCLRLLERIFPVIFEVEGESNAFEQELLWKKEEVEGEDDEQRGAEEREDSQFVIEDEEDSDHEARSPPPPPKPKLQKEKKLLPSLGERLYNCIFDLLFCCGFTLPVNLQVDHHKINYVIWEKGVGSTSDPGPSHAYDSNRIEVLRLLLVLLSRQIYVSPGSLFTKPSPHSLHLVQKTTRRDVLTLLCSLLNVSMNSTKGGETSIGSMAGKFPYNHLVFKGEDPRTILVGLCLQILCVLLDFQSGSARDTVTGPEEAQITPTAKTNAFRYFLMKLHRTKDFDFVIDGIIGIFEQQMAAINNVLPGSRKAIPHINETIIFFWKILELNKKFRLYLLDSEKSMVLLAYLLTYALEIKDKPQQHGLCRALSYIVQTLSAEKTFGARLSSPIKGQVPAKYNNGKAMADFFIQAVYSMVATTSGNLNSLYPALVIALANAAPYFKNLSVTASTRLVQLFTSFSNPLFLLSDEGHPRLLFFMLEVFNSVILHNLSENPNLIYATISSHKTFEDLGTFTLTRGLRDIKRAQLLKEEQARGAESNHKTRGSSEGRDSSDPGTEKARLLNEEGTNEGHSVAERDASVEEENPDVVEEGSTSDTTSRRSEKARGKMRERRSLSVEDPGVAPASVGRNGFVPTQEWVTSWQQGLPLDCVLLVISELLPRIREIHASRKGNATSSAVDFIANVNLSHVLPPSPLVTARRFVWSEASIVWLTSLIWGEIYVRAMTPLGIWNATNVRLFYVKHTQAPQRQLTDTVTNVVGGLLRRTSDNQVRRS